jgi:hypothetical protein
MLPQKQSEKLIAKQQITILATVPREALRR